jgi:SAM-dependent methyltransferase
MSRAEAKAKQAVVDVFTAWPSGSDGTDGEPGTLRHIQSLIERSERYAPWSAEVLGLNDAGDQDVLDVGCGQGVELVKFASRGARVTGVDLVPAHVEQARGSLEALSLNGEVLTGDAERLPFPDQSFDRVISFNALQFTPDMGAAVREIQRVLRPGGEARVVVYHRDSVYYWLGFFLRRGIAGRELFRYGSMSEVVSRNLPWTSPDALPVVHVQSRRGLRKLMAEAGLTDLSTTVNGFSPDHSELTALLARHLSSLRDGRAADVLGKVAGWYVGARGIRPPAPADT